MKKVLFFINSLNGGGAEKVLVDMVNSLSAEKYDITVQTLFSGGVNEKSLNSNIKLKSIIKNSKGYLAKYMSYMIHFVLPAKMVYKLFIKDNYDIEVAYLEGLPLKLIAASDSKAKKMTWVHIDLYTYDHNSRIFKTLKNNIKCYSAFDKIICVSNDVKNMFIKKFGDFQAISVQYNVLDDELIRSLSREKCDLPEKTGVRLVTVGRLVHQKGYDRLLNICERLKQDNLKFELVIVGDGVEKSNLVNQRDRLGLKNDVMFLGYQSNPYKYINNSDVFVCSSRAEGFSTVATEALILGKPIVTTDCAGMHELLDNGEYGIITKNNEDSLFDGLKKMICDESMRNNYASLASKRSGFFCKKNRIEEMERILDDEC